MFLLLLQKKLFMWKAFPELSCRMREYGYGMFCDCSHCKEICNPAEQYNYWNNLCHMLEVASFCFTRILSLFFASFHYSDFSTRQCSSSDVQY